VVLVVLKTVATEAETEEMTDVQVVVEEAVVMLAVETVAVLAAEEEDNN
jgi:hypothetical protein